MDLLFLSSPSYPEIEFAIAFLIAVIHSSASFSVSACNINPFLDVAEIYSKQNG